jgi:hypothetical protein
MLGAFRATARPPSSLSHVLGNATLRTLVSMSVFAGMTLAHATCGRFAYGVGPFMHGTPIQTGQRFETFALRGRTMTVPIANAHFYPAGFGVVSIHTTVV